MIKPHCPDFKSSPLAPWICFWWESEETDIGTEWFCSLPEWEERICESRGLRNISEDALSGPVGINVARLLGIELPPIRKEDEG